MSHRARLVLKLNRSATQITRDDLLGASDIGDGSSKTVGIGIDAVELVPVTIRGGAGSETVNKDPGETGWISDAGKIAINVIGIRPPGLVRCHHLRQPR